MFLPIKEKSSIIRNYACLCGNLLLFLVLPIVKFLIFLAIRHLDNKTSLKFVANSKVKILAVIWSGTFERPKCVDVFISGFSRLGCSFTRVNRHQSVLPMYRATAARPRELVNYLAFIFIWCFTLA